MSVRKTQRGHKPVPPQHMPVIDPHAAAIDVGATEHWVAVPPDADPQPVRRFGTYTADLIALADWLEACGITSVAIEATGVYWIPLFEMLVAEGFEVFLVDASYTKRVKGRPKTDRRDCQWIYRLHRVGLLSAAFRPGAATCVLRSYLRQRHTLIRSASPPHLAHAKGAGTDERQADGNHRRCQGPDRPTHHSGHSRRRA